MMSDSAQPHRSADDYRRLAQTVTSPELKSLLIRMAEVWDALSVYCDRIASARAKAENMLNEARSQHVLEPAASVDSPELSPLDCKRIDQEDLVQRDHAE